MHLESLQQKVSIFMNNVYREGETSYLPTEKKFQNEATGETNTLSHKQRLGQEKLIFEISEIKIRKCFKNPRRQQNSYVV